MWNAIAAMAVALVAFAGPALASADYPNKPIRLVVPYPAGGVTDLLARSISEEMGKRLGQAVIVENKPGASGTLAPSQLKNQAADGYAIGIAPVTIFRLPHMQEMNLDPVKDLTYITMLADYEFSIAVKKDSEWNTMQDLIDFSKTHKHSVNYASTGNYGTAHLAMSKLEEETGGKFTNVPYKNDTEAIVSVLQGSTDVAVVSNTLLPFVQDGRMKVLVSLSPKRSAEYPDAPTLVELGYDVVSNSPFGVVGPPGMPAEIIKKLESTIEQITRSDTYIETARKFGLLANFMNSEAYTAYAKATFESEGEALRKLADTLK